MYSKLDEAIKAKDKAEVQLAPFLAVANKQSQGDPEDKRLELLIGRFDAAVLNVEKAAKKLSTQRSIPPEISDRIVNNLKSVSPFLVEIEAVAGDQESIGLSKQIKNIFEKAGWKVNWHM